MDLETTQKITNIQRRLDAQELPERPTDLVSSFMALPGLRGFWPMSAFGGAVGATFDQSSNGRILTYNGNPTYNYDGLVPYIDLDGTGDFLSRGDEGGLDILGTETYVAAAVRGLTLGGWFWFNGVGAQETCMSKWGAVGQRSYNLDKLGNDTVRLVITNDGSTNVAQASSNIVTANGWFFCVGRFDPSTEVAIFLNGIKSSNIAGIPASIFNSNTAFNIGGANGAILLTGRASLCFLCAAMLSDTIIDATFQATRAAFGV